MKNLKRMVKTAAVVAAATMSLSACNFSVYSLPLPGGPSVGDNPIEITAEFRDVLDLVPQSTVKVNDVSVGKVTKIELVGEHALVTMQIQGDLGLPDNAIAKIRQTSLLGEKFVSISPPDQGASLNPLESGDNIVLSRTDDSPEVADVLGALSLVLNGGGVAQLQTITHELGTALKGRESAARSLLTQIDTFMAVLDDNKTSIVVAIDALNHLAVQANAQRASIEAALDELPSAVASVSSQRRDFVKMLQALNHLSDVGVRVIDLSKTSTISAINSLAPTLQGLAKAGDSIVTSLNGSLTYPFVDEVVGRDPQVARSLAMGDYTNLSIQLDLNPVDLANLGLPGLPSPSGACIPIGHIPPDVPLGDIDLMTLCRGALNQVNDCITDMKDGSLDTDSCNSLLTNIPNQVLGTLCAVVPVPGLPNCPAGTSNDGRTKQPLKNLLDNLLPGLLPRPGFGASQGGYTMRQLSASFDPSLVALLIPGMVTR